MFKDIYLKIKMHLEDFSFRYRLIRRKVTIRNGSFMVFAWHPKPWVMEDTPPVSWMLDRKERMQS